MPTGPQRAAIEGRCIELEKLGHPGPEKGLVKAIAGLLAFYATGRTGEGGTDVKIRGYMIAVEDLPAWAVGEAIRRWFRGQCGQQSYDFAPAPAVLRQVASEVALGARGQLVVMRRLLNAKPADEITAEERAATLAKLDAEGILTAKPKTMRSAEQEADEAKRRIAEWQDAPPFADVEIDPEFAKVLERAKAA